jgi:hypothetical protein
VPLACGRPPPTRGGGRPRPALPPSSRPAPRARRVRQSWAPGGPQGAGGGGGRRRLRVSACGHTHLAHQPGGQPARQPARPPPRLTPPSPRLHTRSELTEQHRRLAEITEMIHTASLVHDDVLDECSVRRGAWVLWVLGSGGARAAPACPPGQTDSGRASSPMTAAPQARLWAHRPCRSLPARS